MKRHLLESKAFADANSPRKGAVVEVPVLLEARSFAALEKTASALGLTVGALVRCLLREFLSEQSGTATARKW